MKIGIIGIGEIGGTLAARWSRNGHSLRVANSRGPEAARAFADGIGATATDVVGAVEEAEVVLLSMPFPAVTSLPKGLFDRAERDVVIIDTANYYPDIRDPRIAEIDAGIPESVWVSRQLGRTIFKAFNSIMFHALSNLGSPQGAPDRLALPVAGDDARGKQVVMDLVNETGFDPVDGGRLEDSWRQQPSTPAYCCDYDAARTRQGLEAAVKGRAETVRDTLWRERYMALFADKPAYADVHPRVIALNRSLNPL
ncbi:NADPH-dependent F420 reductase [Hoeflea ulvae]|uniref:NAD(P)-binding domain-containing protein n=1 Tax=Hoeflea ulvae TaxID=2983764 RepID=A0ABT3YGG2_9HYPH|nr:NAD(P)-binding domain-containing protein [Hoeflea ulvae]MCY0094990.1 NAD(P)-binding domain-containing protein [Hoeflea ulvae]